LARPAEPSVVTQWVENPRGGRDRGPRGVGRAWAEVLVRPGRFFRNGVAPGSLSGYRRIADATGSVYLSAVVVVGVACFLVAPLVLHLAAALGTLALVAVVDDRAGVSETVQVIAYATAPAVFAAVPVPAVQVVATLYGSLLLAVGIAVVHETSAPRAAAAAALPALFVFGLAFGGVGALEAITGVELTPDRPTG